MDVGKIFSYSIVHSPLSILQLPTMIDFQRYTLANGLKVILHDDTATPLIALNILYNVGSRDENPEHTGLAHLFEHLMFGGSKNAKDYDTPIQQAGGESNAFTNNDMTNYHAVVPTENLETLMWLESDRMLSLLLTQKSLNVQKKVVVEEFTETTLNEPYGDVWHHLGDLVFKKHPYRWPVIGLVPEHVEKTTLESAQIFYKNHYAPDNAILCIAGNITQLGGYDAVLDMVKKWFEAVPAQGRTKTDLPQEDEQLERRTKTVSGKVPTSALYMTFHGFARMHPNYYALDLITDILSGGASSVLYQKLVKENHIFSEIDCFQTGSMDAGLFLIEGKPMPGITLETAEKAVWEQLTFLKNNLVSERELEKLKNKIESQNTFSDAGALAKAMSLSMYELVGDANLINTEINFYRALTPLDIQRVAQSLFLEEKISVLYYLAA